MNKSYMQQLDPVESNTIAVLTCEDGAPEWEINAEVVEEVKCAIRQKMLESYRNGQQAGGRPARRAQ